MTAETESSKLSRAFFAPGYVACFLPFLKLKVLYEKPRIFELQNYALLVPLSSKNELENCLESKTFCLRIGVLVCTNTGRKTEKQVFALR